MKMETWQKDYITDNMDTLVESTNLNSMVLAYLQAKRILDRNDIWELDTERNEGLKIFKFYEIIKEKKQENVFEELINVFSQSNQSGVIYHLKKAVPTLEDSNRNLTMGVCLLKNGVITLQPSLTPNTSFEQQVGIQGYMGKDQAGKHRTEKLEKILIHKRRNEDRSLQFRFKFHGEEKAPKLDIAVEGNFLKELHNLLYFGNNEENLKLGLTIQVFMSESEGGSRQSNVCVLKVNANDLKPSPASTLPSGCGSVSHCLYEQKNIQLKHGKWRTKECQCKLFLVVEADDFIPLGSTLPCVAERNRKILRDRKFCDFKIIAEDGTPVPCHKIFLTESPVLAAMVGTNDEDSNPSFEEGAKNQLSLVDMSADGVNALLEFLYCNMVAKPIKSSSIALELFQAGHKYHIPTLEQAARTILMEKSCKWYDVDTATKMYQFVRNYEGGQKKELNDKFIQILQSTPDLKSSPMFQQIFGNDVAMEILQMVLDQKK